MPHSTGQQLSRYVLALLVFASPLLAHGSEGQLAPVVDLNPRHMVAASASLEEPRPLIVAAEAIPLSADAQPPALPAAKPPRNPATQLERSPRQPTVRAAATFDPTTSEPRSPRKTSGIDTRRDGTTLAPVIRVHQPIRPAQNPRFNESDTAAIVKVEPNEALATRSEMPEAVHRSIFLATRTDRLERANAPRTRPVEGHDILSARMLATLDSLARPKPPAAASDRLAPPAKAAEQLSNESPPLRSGLVHVAERNPVAGSDQPSIPREQTFGVAEALPEPSSPDAEHTAKPIVLRSPTAIDPLQDAVASQPEPVSKLVDETLREKLAPREAIVPTTAPAATASPVLQFVEAQPLLAVLQPSPSASDLPAPREELPPTEEQIDIAKTIEALEQNVKPIKEMTFRAKPEAGVLPRNYASARFSREGEVEHRMGFSRAQTETLMMWQAPAICHRPLYFEDINLERHGYKIPLVQPAISAAHFFGRVPLLPYMMVSEGHRNCQYTLGHYRPGDYAPYSLYVPRLRLDASAAEAAVVAGVIFAFP